MKKIGNKGMTLTETIVAFALITMVSFIAVSGFTATATLIRRGLDLQAAGAQAAAQAERDWGAGGGEAAELRLYAAGGGYLGSISGEVDTTDAAINDNEAVFSTFTAD